MPLGLSGTVSWYLVSLIVVVQLDDTYVGWLWRGTTLRFFLIPPYVYATLNRAHVMVTQRSSLEPVWNGDFGTLSRYHSKHWTAVYTTINNNNKSVYLSYVRAPQNTKHTWRWLAFQYNWSSYKKPNCCQVAIHITRLGQWYHNTTVQ